MELTKDQKRYLSHFSEPKFTSGRFVSMLLSGLYQNGVYEINEKELSKKLFYYYQNPNYKELFQDITKERNANRVDIYEAMYNEKYMSGHIWWTSNDSERLHLDYGEGLDSSYYEKYLSENGIKIMKEMIEELATSMKLEKDCCIPLQIYKTSPNQNYHLVRGVRPFPLEGELCQLLITDGNIKSDLKQEKKDSNIHYANPIEDDCWVTLKSCITRDIEVENANYVAIQGIKHGNIKKLTIYTEIVDFDKLNQIKKISLDGNYYLDFHFDDDEIGPYLVKKEY